MISLRDFLFILYSFYAIMNGWEEINRCVSSPLSRGGGSMTDYELAMLILTIISVVFTILGYFQKR